MAEKRFVIIISIIAALVIAIISLDCGAIIRSVQSGTPDHVLLIDPGHGGMDGGAVSGDGTSEKNINLAVALELADAASEYGWQVIMTRSTDEWLCSTEEGSIRSRKTEDLLSRREMITDYEPELAVSIHLNSFKEDPSVSGAQVFYPDSGGSEGMLQQCREFAETLQRNLPAGADKDKHRTAMVKDDVMIFKEVICPVVIIECGFLSNPQEADLLKTKEYQQELAQGIMAGITEFTGVEKKTDIELIDSF